MALASRHYKIAQAIQTSLRADTELVAAIPSLRWVIQKKAYHRDQSWTKGAYIVCMRRTNPPHENQTLRIVFPVLVAAIWPKDEDLTADLESELAVAERIEMIFANKGRTTAPAPMQALDSALTGTNEFKFEMTEIVPGDPFMDGAFQSGYDAMATIINVTCSAPKLDSSTLGA